MNPKGSEPASMIPSASEKEQALASGDFCVAVVLILLLQTQPVHEGPQMSGARAAECGLAPGLNVYDSGAKQ